MIDPNSTLTPREKDVLRCRCADDLTVPQTAKHLGIAPTTVTELSRRAYVRLGVRSIGAACFTLAGVDADGERVRSVGA